MKTLEELNKEIKRKIEELDELNMKATLLGRLSCEMSNEMVDAFSAYMYYWDIDPIDVDDYIVSHFRKSYVGYFKGSTVGAFGDKNSDYNFGKFIFHDRRSSDHKSSCDLYERFVDYRYHELSQFLLSTKFYKVKNYYFEKH